MDFTSEYICMLIDLMLIRVYVYSTTHLKVSSAPLFTVRATSGHVDPTSLAELGVEVFSLSQIEVFFFVFS